MQVYDLKKNLYIDCKDILTQQHLLYLLSKTVNPRQKQHPLKFPCSCQNIAVSNAHTLGHQPMSNFSEIKINVDLVLDDVRTIFRDTLFGTRYDSTFAFIVVYVSFAFS